MRLNTGMLVVNIFATDECEKSSLFSIEFIPLISSLVRIDSVMLNSLFLLGILCL